MRTLFTLMPCCLLLLSPSRDYAQSPPPFPEVRIFITKSQYNNLVQSKGQKLTLKNPVFLINRDTAAVKEAHSRGNNSLTFERKSISVDLENSLTLHQGGHQVKIKKFDLLNLVMDKNLWHSRWAFLAMADIGIFPLYQSYCKLWINDQPQGIYLLVEKPHHYTDTKAKSPYALRRGINHSVQSEYIDTPAKEDAKKYKKQYLALYEDINKFHGDELFSRLNAALYLDHYFDWIGFNYLIMNGDYADEVFFYILPETGKFDVIPWDYDDIFKPSPHEGLQSRNAVAGLKNKMVYSSEDPLDRAIALDDVVYRQYLLTVKKLLLSLTPEMLTGYSDRVRTELQTLSEDKPIADASLFLGRDSFKWEDSKEDLRLALDFIIKRRNALLTELEK